MKRILSVTALLLFLTITCSAQTIKKMEHDPSALLGKWLASTPDMTYELVITRGEWFAEPINVIAEVLYGDLTYSQNGVVIKKRGKDEALSPIIGSLNSPHEASFLMYEKNAHRIGAHAYFTLDPQDHNTAKWTMTLTDRLGSRLPKREFDVPFEMTFRRVVE